MLVKDMNPRHVQGIYVYEKKIFYYLETGHNRTTYATEALRDRLVGMNIIVERYADKVETYAYMTLDKARKAGYTIEPVYYSSFIEALVKANTESQNTIWKKS